MKRSEFLNDIERQLTAKREIMVQSINSELSELRKRNGATDWEDECDDVDDVCDDLNSRLAERGAAELQQINDALVRLRAGTYGECENCGQQIPTTRLKALPYATSCVTCQTQREQSPHRIDSYRAFQWSPSASDFTTEDLDSYEEGLTRNPMLECRALQVI